MDRIDRVRLFVRIAERGTISAAASDRNVKQSTASKAVAELEASLGTRLIERTTRSLHLTEAGHRFLPKAKQLLAAYDELSEDFRKKGEEPSGRLRLSIPVVFGRHFLLEPLLAFAQKHRKIELDVVFDDRYVNLVEEGIDLAVRVGVPLGTSARGYKLGDGRRRLVASPSYVRERGKPNAPKDLRLHECVSHLGPSAPSIWRFRAAGGRDVPVNIRGRITCNNSEAALHVARGGLGIAMLMDWLVDEDIKKKRLVVLLENFESPPVPIYALVPGGPFTPLAVRSLVDHLAKSLRGRIANTSLPRRTTRVRIG